MRVLVSAVVVEDAACDDAEVFGEVEGCSDDEEGEKEEEDGVCGALVSLLWVSAGAREVGERQGRWGDRGNGR